ncbi:MAG: hypothetical protein GY943_28055 [Chloroflexi bacterium]|nr:hypothetical protein [Chloroflexota bacterium]
MVERTAKSFIKRQLKGVKAQLDKRYQAHNSIMFWNGSRKSKRVGIYLRGACDLGAIFACEPFVNEVLDGTCAIMRSGFGAASTRTDILLQTLEDWSPELLDPIIEKLRLNPNYFKPHLFEKEFTVQGPMGPEQFSKDVVILSLAPDLVRNAYRHRETDLIVDPGGWWLNQNMGNVLKDLTAVSWFNKTFRKIGKISPEESRKNFTELITKVREETGCKHVIVLNLLSLEPGDQTYNYQFVRNSQVIRRKVFDIMLWDLSRELDFSVVDIDKLLKRLGVKEQVDFAHWPLDRFEPVAKEVFRIMQDRGVFD